MYTYDAFRAIAETATPFSQKVFHQLTASITHPDFPCYFAKTGIVKDSIYLAFIEESDPQQRWEKAAAVMADYAEIEKNHNPFRVLVLSFDLHSPDWYSDDALLWSFLAFLRKKDPEPWPSNIPQNPDEAGWFYCYGGYTWFFNVNSPNHVHRKSRNATGVYSLVIQRSAEFDDLAPAEQHDHIRHTVRSRIAAYDGQETSFALAGEADNPTMKEWPQYHLPESNNDKPWGKCPFSSHGN